MGFPKEDLQKTVKRITGSLEQASKEFAKDPELKQSIQSAKNATEGLSKKLKDDK